MDRVHLREIAERTARFVEDIDSARERAAITQEEKMGSRLCLTLNGKREEYNVDFALSSESFEA